MAAQRILGIDCTSDRAVFACLVGDPTTKLTPAVDATVEAKVPLPTAGTSAGENLCMFRDTARQVLASTRPDRVVLLARTYRPTPERMAMTAIVQMLAHEAGIPLETVHPVALAGYVKKKQPDDRHKSVLEGPSYLRDPKLAVLKAAYEP